MFSLSSAHLFFMGKIRAVAMGDEKAEKEQKRRAQARRQTKDSKKAQTSNRNLKN